MKSPTAPNLAVILNKLKARTLEFVVVVLFAGCLFTSCANQSSPPSSNSPGPLPSHSQSIFHNLNIALVSVDLNKGTHLVVLIDTGCSHCQAAVPSFNQLMVQTQNTPPLVALCSNFEEEVTLFRKTYQPEFPLGILARPDFLRLLEDEGTPRTLLVKDGFILHVWDGQIPTASEILQLLPDRRNS